MFTGRWGDNWEYLFMGEEGGSHAAIYNFIVQRGRCIHWFQ